LSGEQVHAFPLKKILVATDGSKNAERAVDAAIHFSKQFQAELIVLSVVMELVPPVYSPIGVNIPSVDYSAYLGKAEADGRKVANNAAERAQNEAITTKVVVLKTVTSIAEAILEEASREKVNLIVVGTRGLGGFKKLLLGSVSSATIDHAHCSVLVIR
jgi:nucleotide-binding universal stress UspA family protein